MSNRARSLQKPSRTSETSSMSRLQITLEHRHANLTRMLPQIQRRIPKLTRASPHNRWHHIQIFINLRANPSKHVHLVCVAVISRCRAAEERWKTKLPFFNTPNLRKGCEFREIITSASSVFSMATAALGVRSTARPIFIITLRCTKTFPMTQRQRCSLA